MSEHEWQEGDVAQVDPEHDPGRFGGALLVVEEVKSWGVQGYVWIPARGAAYYRCPFEALSYIGRAQWRLPE